MFGPAFEPDRWQASQSTGVLAAHGRVAEPALTAIYVRSLQKLSTSTKKQGGDSCRRPLNSASLVVLILIFTPARHQAIEYFQRVTEKAI